MHIQAIFIELAESLLQIGVAVVVTILQRWLLGLSTYEKDLAWLKRQKIYQMFVSIKWYRGIEAYHQWNAYKVYFQ